MVYFFHITQSDGAAFQFIPGLHGPALVRDGDGPTDHQADEKRLFQFLVADAFFETADDMILDAIITP